MMQVNATLSRVLERAHAPAAAALAGQLAHAMPALEPFEELEERVVALMLGAGVASVFSEVPTLFRESPSSSAAIAAMSAEECRSVAAGIDWEAVEAALA